MVIYRFLKEEWGVAPFCLLKGRKSIQSEIMGEEKVRIKVILLCGGARENRNFSRGFFPHRFGFLRF